MPVGTQSSPRELAQRSQMSKDFSSNKYFALRAHELVGAVSRTIHSLRRREELTGWSSSNCSVLPARSNGPATSTHSESQSFPPILTIAPYRPVNAWLGVCRMASGASCHALNDSTSKRMEFRLARIMRFLSSIRIVRVSLALAVALWMAGFGCLLGCENMVSAQ